MTPVTIRIRAKMSGSTVGKTGTMDQKEVMTIGYDPVGRNMLGEGTNKAGVPAMTRDPGANAGAANHVGVSRLLLARQHPARS